MRNVGALNAQVTRTLNTPKQGSIVPRLRLAAFADAAWGTLDVAGASARAFADAGVGLTAHGTLFDRSVVARLDFPVYVRQPELAVGDDAGGARVRLRWSFSFTDLW
jgi:hypothetical protein